VYLREGFNGGEVARQLIELAAAEENLVVGLDFAFSMPSWFLRDQGIGSARELWARAGAGGCETWLAGCSPPFWGRAGSRKRAGCELYRRTEREVRERTGFLPKSVFQIGGAGAVGTGSLRGMGLLHALRGDGFRVWPYDDPGMPVLVEIYPRVLTGAVRKSDAIARKDFVEQRYGHLSEAIRDVMASSEDAFDVGVSALEMWRHRDSLALLPAARDEVERLEGAVWLPG
jgi:hypothetical protein